MAKLFNCQQLYMCFISALDILNSNEDLLNHINVFPVADQDTGKNMSLSFKAACDVLDKSSAPVTMVKHAADALLEQARGNSGTILSLFFQGFANALSDTSTLNCKALADAFSRGAEFAQKGIAEPRPGTILTLAAKAAETGQSYLKSTDDPAELMARIADEAFTILPLTTFQNPTLEKYHVIDSGALGFCMILDGFCAGFSGNESVSRNYDIFERTISDFSIDAPVFKYCTEFVIKRPSDQAIKVLKKQLSQMGDCIIPAADEKFLKMHIHTNRPDAVFFVASLCGQLRRTKIDNMLLSCNSTAKKNELFLCRDDLTLDGLKSMGKRDVFTANEQGIEKFRDTVISLASDNSDICLYTSVKIDSVLEERVSKIRFFSDDDALLDYMFSL